MLRLGTFVVAILLLFELKYIVFISTDNYWVKMNVCLTLLRQSNVFNFSWKSFIVDNLSSSNALNDCCHLSSSSFVKNCL